MDLEKLKNTYVGTHRSHYFNLDKKEPDSLGSVGITLLDLPIAYDNNLVTIINNL